MPNRGSNLSKTETFFPFLKSGINLAAEACYGADGRSTRVHRFDSEENLGSWDKLARARDLERGGHHMMLYTSNHRPNAM